MKKFTLSILLTLILSSQPTFAESSIDYGLMAKKSWSAFGCSSLANYAKLDAEQERLFNIGYNSGMAYLQARKDGKIPKEDLNKKVPYFFLILIQGPNNDFILGRAFQYIGRAILGNFAGELNLSLRQVLASTKFNEQNCDLIK